MSYTWFWLAGLTCKLMQVVCYFISQTSSLVSFSFLTPGNISSVIIAFITHQLFYEHCDFILFSLDFFSLLLLENVFVKAKEKKERKKERKEERKEGRKYKWTNEGKLAAYLQERGKEVLED